MGRDRSRSRSPRRREGRRDFAGRDRREVPREEVRVERIPEVVRQRPGVKSRDERDRDAAELERMKAPKTQKQLEASRAALLEDAFGYDKHENPFGDDELAKAFVWKKKIVADAAAGTIHDTRVDAMMDQSIAKVREIEEVRRRRDERERLEDELIEARALEAREKALESHAEWRKKEEEFAKGVAMDRLVYRLESGREGHVDLVVKAFIMANYHKFNHINFSSVALHEAPLHGVVHGLMEEEAINLLEELNLVIDTIGMSIKGFKAKPDSFKFLESVGADGIEDPSTWPSDVKRELLEFLKAFRTLINYARRDQGMAVPGMGPPLRLAPEVAPQVVTFFQGQSVSELVALKPQVEQALQSAADTNFFEGVLDLIPYYIARGICEDLMDVAQQTVMSIQAKTLEEEKKKKLEEEEEIRRQRVQRVYDDPTKMTLDEKAHVTQLAVELYEIAPTPLSKLTVSFMKRMMDPEDDYAQLKEQRKEMLILYKSRKRGLRTIPRDEDGVVQVLTTADLQPRKPRFENKVRTGYDWNRYNQTHYDVNNPPPKMVQGYKFNIFYPDLIDKNTTPTWKLEPCPGDDGQNTVTIRFSAGPPYQDIAFRILNREWDVHPMAHFVNKFEKGILQLHFSLKRMRYRK